ncbi:coiled-coil domain-containing protein 157 [Geospiza fortis]|uniref:Coiled-coil domain-containing protein 157 n=1 Tax=Geospiza fortis TaxID=48883 RepID=A0A8N5F1J9_GEOFO|nr:coiled-coil domain-containing protein 157 [Geospiza fortis]
MESLRADLRDLQAAIADVCSRAGALRFPSWKFPDKVSCELDIAVLLQRYRHSDSEPEFSQHAHVVLLELLIDRLLLLLQSFTGYAEAVLSGRALPPPRGPGPGMSAGLTARAFWSSMLKLGALCQQLRDQVGKYQKEHLKCISPEVVEPGTASEAAQPTSVCPNLSVQPRAGPSVALSTRSVPTQTPGSPLASCDTCSSAQASLHEVGRAITSICQSQNIPSALSKFQEVLEDGAGRRNLSATDMSYWASEQSKDLSRINKHLQGLLQQLNPVRAELEEMGKQKDKLQKQVEDFSRKLQAEKNTQAEQQKAAEQSLKAKEKEHSEAVARLEQDKDDLRRGAALLEEQLSALKEELAAKEVAVQELELSKTTLLEEMSTTMVAQSQVLELEEKVQVLTGQKDSLEQELSASRVQLEQELSASRVQLEKEKVRVESLLWHEEVQPEPGMAELLLLLLARLPALGQAEEDKARLAEQLEQSQQHSGKQLQAQQELLDTLQQEKLALQQSILELQANTAQLQEQAQELRERERLLVFFPDLHMPAETQFESSGNLTEDMKSQLQANKIRIEVLERENTQLEALLAKVKAAAEQGVLKLVPQAQLGSQLHRAASRQDTGRLSSGSSGDSPGMPGCLDKAWHRAASSQHSKKLRAEPSPQAKPCLTLPVRRLGLGLPSLHTGAHRK